mgnify:CR=1 FL=1
MSILEIKEVTENYGKKILYTNPHIYTMTHFLTKDECDHFINLGKGNMSRALVSGTAKGYESKGRSGSNYWIKHDVDEITSSVAEKISILVGVPVENAEAFQLIHYDATQEYRQHYDGWVLNENDIDGYKK